MTRRMLAGDPRGLGATVVDGGVNIAVFSEHATAIELCVFDPKTLEERERLALPETTNHVHHGLLPGAGPGLVYGLRAHGPDDPLRGHRFNPAKLLLDPYARRLAGRFRWTDAHLGGPNSALDNAADQFKAVVTTSDDFDWGDDRRPAVPMADTVLYEVHVRGFTRLNFDVEPSLRGTYEGLASPASIAHLKSIGVTTVSLLPVHEWIDEYPLARRGLVNYWGYNTLAYFVPTARFARADARDEFRRMVRALHAAGVEVVIDVVYNHTAEGDERGPTLSWRGLDNSVYYRLRREDARAYENHSGCGNTLNVAHPRVMQMVMDSLRFWAVEMRVDGFRFDLASALARGEQGFDRRSAFLQAIAQDPVLSRLKLIAEPWDSGPGGYQLGNFGGGWSEWNDRYRDAMRAFWVRKTADRGQFVSRLAGSSDLFGRDGRAPQASVNFIIAHDGFTLRDLVSYDRKHNEANGEANRDGTDNNLSWNCGYEGPTNLLAVNALRSRLERALLATLMLSRGVPMLAAGDELGRTQRGNNNAYLHDNDLSWIDWAGADRTLIDFVGRMTALRRRYPQLRGRRWLDGQHADDGHRDVIWLNRKGTEMVARHWDERNRFLIGMVLTGRAATDAPPDGRVPTLLVLFNAEARDWSFPLPAGVWRMVLDTELDEPFSVEGRLVAGETEVLLHARSLMVLDDDVPEGQALPMPPRIGEQPADPSPGIAAGTSSASATDDEG